MILVLNKDISPPAGCPAHRLPGGPGPDRHQAALSGARPSCCFQGKQTGRTPVFFPLSLWWRASCPGGSTPPLASRRSHPADTVVQVGDVFIGGGHFCLMAGPCRGVRGAAPFHQPQRQAAGAQLLQGGAYKPRTSPYSFSGLREEGLALLRTSRRETGLPVVSEIMSATDLPLFEDVDILQVGARNMQNYDLLRALGRCRKPVLLKRGPAATVQELLLSASTFSPAATKTSFSASGGIRTFSGGTRSALDLSAVPLLHELTHLPVIVDPSHAVGRASLVPPMAHAPLRV